MKVGQPHALMNSNIQSNPTASPAQQPGAQASTPPHASESDKTLFRELLGHVLKQMEAGRG